MTNTILRDALRKAYNFGQTYWQQADSEYLSQQKKSNETADKFATFVDETCAALAAADADQAPDADENAPWLTLAHTICADAGVPCGHITDRLTALRDRLDAARPAPVGAADDTFMLKREIHNLKRHIETYCPVAPVGAVHAPTSAGYARHAGLEGAYQAIEAKRRAIINDQSAKNALFDATEIIRELQSAAPAAPADPCPQCQPGGVCKTPTCGRLRSSELMALYGAFAQAAPKVAVSAPTWQRITAPGQVKVGDDLRFNIGDTFYSETVKQILHPGMACEELIYNKRKNYYVITSNAITNFGSSKNVEFLAAEHAKPEPVNVSAMSMQPLRNIVSIPAPQINTSPERVDSVKVEQAGAVDGAARYEFVRRLHPHEFANLWRENIAGGGAFDDLVDRERKASAAANQKGE